MDISLGFIDLTTYILHNEQAFLDLTDIQNRDFRYILKIYLGSEPWVFFFFSSSNTN